MCADTPLLGHARSADGLALTVAEAVGLQRAACNETSWLALHPPLWTPGTAATSFEARTHPCDSTHPLEP